MMFRFTLLAATILAAPIVLSSGAKAQPVTGPYVSLGAGTSIVLPYNNNASLGTVVNGQLTPGAGGKVLTRPAFAGVGAAGYGFGDGFRVEVGGNFYRNTITKIDRNDGTQIQAGGIQNTFGVMGNAYYDFDVGWPIFPYVGAGIGYQWLQYQKNTINGNVRVSGSQGSFAYQLIGGIAYPIAPVPGLSVTAEYRFMQLTGNRSYRATGPSGVQLTDKVGQEISNTVLIGLRYQIFNPPPPPPPAPVPVAAPAPAPAKTYLVFFDWDKANLTPRATQIIAQAASDSKTTQVTTIEVSGYTDTSGTAVYNQGLSIRRAKAVAAQLVVDGVPASEITTQGFGDTHLLVQTGPGVREPQNRRVEIVLQ
jgi:OOP family OmpA-OmpF porin